MKRYRFIVSILALLTAGIASADEADTLKVVDVEEVLVIAAPKENRKLREQPVAVTLLSQQDIQNSQVNSIKKLTGLVPNMFIPDYGSRLTSAIYIRGIGSRINTPSIGLYVDNMPYIDKSAFDFSYADVERIDVLRGPQGTLYGRNAMGGLIKIHTKSPFSYQGTDFRMGAGTRNAYNKSITHYHRVSEHFAFSAGGFYDYQGGFFRNSARNEKADKGQSAGGRIRAIYLPSENWKIDLNVSYEYSDQTGYPYFYMGSLNPEKQNEALKPYVGKIANNERSSYHRNLLNTGLNLEYQARNFTLSAVTGYQFLKDRMFMDQDFTPSSIFNIEQKQKMNTLSEEIILKSKPGRRWQWTTGAFGLYQWLHTEGPVVFHKAGIGNIIENNVNRVFDAIAMQGAPAMHLDINNENLRIGGSFDTPVLSGALFHQSAFNDLFVKGLSATIGLRLDYEKIKMNYNSATDATDFNFSLTMKQPPMSLKSEHLQGNASYQGKESTDYVQLLPKFALQYELKKGSNVYVTVARGYRSGGYNIQMFSDLLTGVLKNSMMDAIAADPKFSRMGAMIEKMKSTNLPEVSEATRYKPEYTWNYEAGSHLTLWKGRLLADMSVFYMDTRDQQIAKFAESGLGRTIVNAGRSHSYGAEASLRAAVTDALTLNACYGYTHATFKDYITNEKGINGQIQEVDYNGKYVPFVPKHTLNIGGQYVFRIKPGYWLDQIQLDADYTGAGRVYWTEANTVGQAFYGTLNGRISLRKGNGQIALWVRNALDKDYTAFYFESMGNGLRQKGRPVQAGIELRCRF